MHPGRMGKGRRFLKEALLTVLLIFVHIVEFPSTRTQSVFGLETRPSLICQNSVYSSDCKSLILRGRTDSKYVLGSVDRYFPQSVAEEYVGCYWETLCYLEFL